jgi:predicted RNase H-like HicB family nuclease
MRRYIALLHRDAEGGYGVSFPDFPGCITAGDDWEKATSAGADALHFHVEGMLADGAKLPKARSPEELCADRAIAAWFDGAIVTSIPLLPLSAKPERVNVMLDSALLHEIDHAARHLGMNRSAFLSAAARQLLGGGADLPLRNADARSGKSQPRGLSSARAKFKPKQRSTKPRR